MIVALVIVDGAALGILAPIMGQQLPWLPYLLFTGAASVPALLALTLVPVRYRLEHRGLVVRSGLSLRWRIPLANIHRVVPVVSLRPAPALSAQRLRLDYQHGTRIRSVQISPVTPDLFLHDLTTLDEGLSLSDGSVTRHGGPILLFESSRP